MIKTNTNSNIINLILTLKKITNYLGRVSVSKKGIHTIKCKVNPSQLSSYLEDNGYFFDPAGDQQNVKYIIEGHIFEKRLYVDTEASIDFIDCQFLNGMDVLKADTICLKKNRHFLADKKELRGDPYLIIGDVKEVILEEEDLSNRIDEKEPDCDFDIDLCADKITMKESQITTPKGRVSINAGYLEFTKSNITAKDVTLDTEIKPVSDLESKIKAKTLHWYREMGSALKVEYEQFDRKKKPFTKVKK